jgi:hypothetical protein
VAFKNTSTGTTYGPWAQIGYTRFNGTLGASKSDPGNVLGPPDNYWMAYPAQIVPAGTYQVIDSDPTTWAYTSDLQNEGCAWVYGWFVGAAADAGAPDGPVGIKDAGGAGAADGAALPATGNLIINGDAEQGVVALPTARQSPRRVRLSLVRPRHFSGEREAIRWRPILATYRMVLPVRSSARQVRPIPCFCTAPMQ